MILQVPLDSAAALVSSLLVSGDMVLIGCAWFAWTPGDGALHPPGWVS
jgi:hypothetical protein